MNRLHSNSRPALILAWVSSAVVIGSMVFASGPLQGWIAMLGYAGLAGSFPLAGMQAPRRASVSGAVMLLAMGADYGLPRVSPALPRWFDVACSVFVLVACLVFGFLVWPRRVVSSTES